MPPQVDVLATRPLGAAAPRLLSGAGSKARVPEAGPPHGDVAQLVEHLLCKQGVRGSSPLISIFGRAIPWDEVLVLAIRRRIVAGSNASVVGLVVLAGCGGSQLPIGALVP